MGLSFEESNDLIGENPDLFNTKVKESLVRHAEAINKHTAKGTYFFDYGKAFLLEASRAGADIMAENGIDFRYPSYVQDILDLCVLTTVLALFDGFVLQVMPRISKKTDRIAAKVMKKIKRNAPAEIQQQMQDNINWIEQAGGQ